MSFLIYLLIFSIFPSLSTGFTYTIIRNATIQLSFDIPNNLTHQKSVEQCADCLCEALKKTETYLFTCTGNITINYTCQFYYFMPKLDEIYQSNDTNIYVMNENPTFEEKDDCCDTELLINKMSKTSITPYSTEKLRFLVRVDDNTIVSTSSAKAYKINRSTLNYTELPNIEPVKTVFYNDAKYYFSDGKSITVYDETLKSLIDTFSSNKGDLAVIRFLNKNQMLVGTTTGAYIFEKQDNETKFQNDASHSLAITGTEGKYVHAFGVIDENTFYVGYYERENYIHLYTKNKNNSWIKNENGSINRTEGTSDIFVDKCQRIWVVGPNQKQISIYEQNKTSSHNIQFEKNLFGILILEDYNYTIIASHSDVTGLSKKNSSLNCRPLRKNPISL